MGSKKILVTGGAGYIGSHTVVELYHAGYTPIILDDFSNSEKGVIHGINKIIKDEVKWYEGDCRDTEYLNKVLLLEKEITGVIHFAAAKAVGESVANPLKYYDNNIGSLVQLLKGMNKSGIHNMVFSSSCTVYGQANKLPVTEDTDIMPAESPYGNTKQIGEEILSDLALADNELNAISLRYFNPVGAHPSGLIGELPIGIPNNLVPYITQTAAGIREKLVVYGDDYNTEDGTCIRDFIHVVDLAKAHVKALDAIYDGKLKNYCALNCGTGGGNTVMQLINAFEKVTGEKLNYELGPRRPGDIEAVYADAQKAQDLLGWKAELSLEEALADSWNWQKTLSS